MMIFLDPTALASFLISIRKTLRSLFRIPSQRRANTVTDRMPQLTQRARRVLSVAQEEADRRRRYVIDTEHLLLALLREEEGIAGQLLRAVGLDVTQFETLLQQTGSGSRADLSNEQPRSLLILNSKGDVLSANESAQDILDHHGVELLDGINQNVGTATELAIGGQIFLIVSARVSDAGTMVILWDITTLKNLESEVEGLVNSIAFDLASPRHQITGYAQLLQASTHLDDTEKHFVEAIISQADLIDSIISEMMISVRIATAIKNGLHKEPCDVKALVDQVLAELKNQSSDRPINAQFDFPAGAWKVLGDQNLLHTMIWILVKHAVDVSTESKKVRIALSQDQAGFLLRVHDQGWRITEDEKSGRSYMVSDFGRVRTIIEAHGGTVEARNVPTGAESVVFFPSAISLPPEA